ncbi:MAG: ABC transporter ATP-binding protein [Pseudomonadota bacterium]
MDQIHEPGGSASYPATAVLSTPHGGIRLQGVTKRFGRTAAVDDVTVDIGAGEFFVVLGPSGCGKSTLLRLIAGLETLDGGTITLGGEVVAGADTGYHAPPEARSVAVVFQSYALWPHMSVRKNVAFPVEASGAARGEVTRTVDEALKAVALEPFAARKPAALSGGQQQRVALARCLASRASTVLMDEPLANLDVHLRAAMEDELARVHAASGATTLYITHDQREAMALATRIAVMQDGRILQVAAPQTLYERPHNEAVAGFIGRASIIDASVVAVAEGIARIDHGGLSFTARCPQATTPGPARVMLRPHHIHVHEDGAMAARVTRSAYRGGLFELTLTAQGLPPLAAQAVVAPSEGAVMFDITDGWVLPPA